MSNSTEEIKVSARTRLSLVNVFLGTAIGAAALSVFAVLAVPLLVDESLPGCTITITSAPATLSQTGAIYCLDGVVDTSSGGLTVTADSVTLDGRSAAGAKLTGSNASIHLSGRSQVTIRNLNTTGALSILRGGNNQILDSRATFLSLKESSDNTVRGNIITSTGTRAFIYGDEVDLPDVPIWTERNTIENNQFLGNGNRNTRFIYFRHVRNSSFLNNSIRLTNATFSLKANGEPDDSATAIVMYSSFGNTLTGNRVLLTLDPSLHYLRENFTPGAVLTVRNTSSNNLFEANIFHTNNVNGISVQSAGGYENPENNIIRNNQIYAYGNAVRIQGLKAGSQDNIIEGNLLVSQHKAIEVAAGTTDRVVIKNNTLVSQGTQAIWNDDDGTGRVIEFRNNIVDAKNRPVRLGTPAWVANFNNFHRWDAGDLVYYGGTPYETMDDWRRPDRDANSIESNPLFENPAIGDYRLRSDSPARTAGENGAPIGAPVAGPSCLESWSCGAWSACANGRQTRSCNDVNACGTLATQPLESQTCTADTVAPTAQLFLPVNNTTVSGNVNLWAFAQDNIAVAGVRFEINGTSLGSEDTSWPYQRSWSTAGLPRGLYTIKAIARDAAGNLGTSAPVVVTVSGSGGGGGQVPREVE